MLALDASGGVALFPLRADATCPSSHVVKPTAARILCLYGVPAMVFALFVRVLSPSETVTIVGCDGNGDSDVVRLLGCLREYTVESYIPFIP